METGHRTHHHPRSGTNIPSDAQPQAQPERRNESEKALLSRPISRQLDVTPSDDETNEPTGNNAAQSHAHDSPPPPHDRGDTEAGATAPTTNKPSNQRPFAYKGVRHWVRKMLRIFEPLDFKDAKPKRPQQGYVVQPGDTLAGIALRHGMKESEVRAMNNLWEGNVFAGQALVLHRKQRSQSMPSLPGAQEFAERVNRQRASIKESEHRRRVEATNQAEEEPVADEEQGHAVVQAGATSKEPTGRSTLDVILEQAPPAGFFSSLFGLVGASTNASPTMTMKEPPSASTRAKKLERAPRLKTRSYSERLPTNQEEQDDVYALPKLRGATESDILSEARYAPKLVPKIEAFLPMRLRGYDWSLLYSLAQHGSSLHTLMRKARGQRSTLVVVETCKGEIFGGFATTAWTNSLSYYGSGESFVFTTVPAFEVFNWKKTNSMFMYSNEDSIAMGGGGGFAWFLNSDLSRGSTAVSETFGNRPLTSESHFEVANVEVWGFAMF